jgi:hypothetical protein
VVLSERINDVARLEEPGKAMAGVPVADELPEMVMAPVVDLIL